MEERGGDDVLHRRGMLREARSSFRAIRPKVFQLPARLLVAQDVTKTVRCSVRSDFSNHAWPDLGKEKKGDLGLIARKVSELSRSIPEPVRTSSRPAPP